MRAKPEITLLEREDDVLDFINYYIKEENIRKRIFNLLDKDSNESPVIALKVPYNEEPCVVIMKWSIREEGGLLLISSKEWQTIFRVLDDMRDSFEGNEREIFIKQFTDLVRQVNQIEAK